MDDELIQNAGNMKLDGDCSESCSPISQKKILIN